MIPPRPITDVYLAALEEIVAKAHDLSGFHNIIYTQDDKITVPLSAGRVVHDLLEEVKRLRALALPVEGESETPAATVFDLNGNSEHCSACEHPLEAGPTGNFCPECDPRAPTHTVGPKACEHCWHTLDEVFTTCPPIYTDVCCFCPEKRERRPRGEGIMGHGPNHPSG